MSNRRLLAADPHFPPHPSILFSVSLENREVKCAITDDALREFSRVYSHNPMPIFNANVNHIMQIAEKLIQENRCHNAMIVIKSQDVRGFLRR
jgi:hypothetical protein